MASLNETDDAARSGRGELEERSPSNMSELIGRDADLAALHETVFVEERSIVTLWGPGGIGKTSLAHAIVRAAASSLPGSAHFIGLAGARTREDVVAIVDDVLGLRGSGIPTATEGVARIGRSLAARGRTLVVLDNVEQIVDVIAPALTAWSSAAPRTTFVVTTRELLAVPREQGREILPLALESEAGRTPDAVRLLVERARGLRGSFEADDAVLRTITQRLDGIPLAIELAAARLAVMSAEQLLARLDDRFALLRRGHGGSERRQRTLHDAIEWSWSLLDDEERRALAAFSVFRGGFDIDAATSVLGSDAVDPVAALRHKSLIAEKRSRAPRFFLLESIREFAARKLADDTERLRAVRLAHAAHYGARGTAWADAPAGHVQVTMELENLLAGSEMIAEAPADALRCLVALDAVLTSRGAERQLADRLGHALASISPDTVPSDLRSRAFEVQSAALFAIGSLREADAAATTALESSPSDQDRARVLMALGVIRQGRWQLEDAMALEREAYALAVRCGARREQGRALGGLALVHHVLDEFDEARRYYDESLVILREVGDTLVEIRMRMRLGFLLQDIGEHAAAFAEYSEATRLGELHGITTFDALLQGYRGNAERAEGRNAEAIATYNEAIHKLHVSGDRRFAAVFTMDRGIAQLLGERHAEALSDLEAAYAVAAEIGVSSLLGVNLGYLMIARAYCGDFVGARRAEVEGRAVGGPHRASSDLFDIHRVTVDVLEGKEGNAAPATVATELLAKVGTHSVGQHRRIAAGLLRRAVERAAPPEEALVVRDQRLRAPGGEWIDLAKRSSMVGVVQLLIVRQRTSPGAVVSTKDLVAAGWPNEKLVAGAGLNRLRVLVNTLRAAGLKDALRSGEGGYFLDPALYVVTD